MAGNKGGSKPKPVPTGNTGTRGYPKGTKKKTKKDTEKDTEKGK